MSFLNWIADKARQATGFIADKINQGANFIAHKAVPFAGKVIDVMEKGANIAKSVVNAPVISQLMDSNPETMAIKAGINNATGALERGRSIVNAVGTGSTAISNLANTVKSNL